MTKHIVTLKKLWRSLAKTAGRANTIRRLQSEIERLRRENTRILLSRDSARIAARWLFNNGGVCLESCANDCRQQWPWIDGDLMNIHDDSDLAPPEAAKAGGGQ